MAIAPRCGPPVGLAGIEVTYRAQELHGIVCYGAIGVGATKMKTTRPPFDSYFRRTIWCSTPKRFIASANGFRVGAGQRMRPPAGASAGRSPAEYSAAVAGDGYNIGTRILRRNQPRACAPNEPMFHLSPEFVLPPGQQQVAAGKWPLMGERAPASTCFHGS